MSAAPLLLALVAAAPEAPALLVELDCAAPSWPVSPAIFGIGFDPLRDAESPHQWTLGAAARRWGGNASSRYNWRINAWNTGSDWFFRNVSPAPDASHGWERFLDDNRSHGVATALTVPMLGWVARDRESVGFPVSAAGPQRAVDPDHPEAGDGHSRPGLPLRPGPPERTSVAGSPQLVSEWVRAIRARDRRLGGRSVDTYILDNEPMLWNETHRDVHPEPVTYAELWERTVAFAEAIRREDPRARIAGPALWGWTALHYSAADKARGFRLKPDRLGHGDLPFLVWYLRQLRAHEARTGRRLVDVIDVHFYPQGEGLGLGTAGEVTEDAAARRIRSVRALHDPGYRDESWIDEEVQLLPRLRRWVDEHAPGLDLSIGEYNFGAEHHPSGGLAVAEALGRFAEHRLSSAYYWTYPPEGSAAYWALRAYRNFDGRGGRFEDRFLPTRGGISEAPVFASLSRDGRRLVAIALNHSPSKAAQVRIALQRCGRLEAARLFQWQPGAKGLASAGAPLGASGCVAARLPPWSMSVFELSLSPRKGGAECARGR